MAFSKIMLSEDSGIPKWKVALAVGGAVALSAAIYYKFCSSKNQSRPKRDKKSSKHSKPSTNGISTKTAEIDNTPLGQAKQHKTEGNTYFRNCYYDEAIECYNKAIEVCPETSKQDRSTFYQNRAAAFEQKKDYLLVLRDCTSALDLNPRYTKALQRRARAAELLQDLDLALEDYTAICIIETFSVQDSLNTVDRILKQIGLAHATELYGRRRDSLPSQYAVKCYLAGYCNDPVYNAIHSEKEGDGDEAEDVPEKHAVADGYLKACRQLRKEQYGDIWQHCSNELASPLSPYTAQALLLRGAMSVLYSDTAAARLDLTTLADMSTADNKYRTAALIKLGSLEVSHNNSDAAMVAYTRAVEMEPDNPDLYYQRGQMHLMNGKIEDSIANFTKVVELQPSFGIGVVQKLHAEYRYATFKMDNMEIKKILKEFEEARKKFPKCTEVYLLMAQMMVDEERLEEADALFNDLQVIDPLNPVAQVYRAMLLVQWKGDVQSAMNMIKKALDTDNKCEMALENLATIFVQTGNLEEGVRLFNRAIPLAKSLNEMAHYCSLRDAAEAQIKVVKRLGIALPPVSFSL